MKQIKRIAATAAIMLTLVSYIVLLVKFTSIMAPVSIALIAVIITFVIYDIMGDINWK